VGAERHGGFEIDRRLELVRLLRGQIAGILVFEE
jgi:hypothetical protein